MLKKVKGCALIELLAVVAIIGILATLIGPNVITAIQKSKQKTILNDITVIYTSIIKKMKTGNKLFNESIQGIMGVNRAEKELAKSIGILKEHLTKTWRIKPWERNVLNLNNSGLREKKAGIKEI